MNRGPVLTDYHVHLRTDEPEASVAEYHTAANAERYRAVAEERGIAELGCSEHIYRFAQALDVWRHPFWERYAHDDLDAYCVFIREQTDLRLGIEADFVPGAEDRLANLLDAGAVRETLVRGELWSVQTPQVFRRDALAQALSVSADELAAATDDAWLIERAGGAVLVVRSSEENLKITTPHDLRVAELLLAERGAAASAASAHAPRSGAGPDV